PSLLPRLTLCAPCAPLFSAAAAPPPTPTPFPSTTLFRSCRAFSFHRDPKPPHTPAQNAPRPSRENPHRRARPPSVARISPPRRVDRKSTRLNSSHVKISYAVFCLKKKKACLIDSRGRGSR